VLRMGEAPERLFIELTRLPSIGGTRFRRYNPRR